MDNLTFLREKLRRELNETIPLIAVGDETEEEIRIKDIALTAKLYLVADTVNELFQDIVQQYVGDEDPNG